MPITLYFMTHAYFCFYHAVSNVLMRRLGHATQRWRPVMQKVATTMLVFALSYATAYMETLTIAHFPYYTFKVRAGLRCRSSSNKPWPWPVCLKHLLHLPSKCCAAASSGKAGRSLSPWHHSPAAFANSRKVCGSLQDRSRMYTVGSLFYAIYFFVSFPMFFRIDEAPGRRWTVSEAARDALAASMLVTIILDLWRIGFGSIHGGREGAAGLPWMQHEL